MSLEEYCKLTDGVETEMDKADLAAKENEKRYTHDEIFEL